MSKSKLITYIVVALLILAGLYWAYQKYNQEPEVKAGGVVVVSDTAPSLVDSSDQSSKFIAALNEIDSIDLQNRLIFNNKIFTSLQDFGRTIEERATGRNNPFSPFAVGSGLVKNENTATPSNKDANGSGATGEENPADANLLDALSGE